MNGTVRQELIDKVLLPSMEKRLTIIDLRRTVCTNFSLSELANDKETRDAFDTYMDHTRATAQFYYDSSKGDMEAHAALNGHPGLRALTTPRKPLAVIAAAADDDDEDLGLIDQSPPIIRRRIKRRILD
jgi:hypothetical protein